MLLLISLALAGPCEVPQVGRCGTPVLGALSADPDCRGTVEALGFAVERRPDLDVRRSGREVRNYYGSGMVHETEHFAVWWGDDLPVDEDHLAHLGTWFEEARAAQVELGFPDPQPGYKFNVYVGQTGAGPVDLDYAGGYFWHDPQGYPLIVMSQGAGRTTAAHELFHAVQDVTGSYEYRGRGAWYFESTATWIESEVYPDDDDYAAFLFGFSYLPELTLSAFEYPDEATLESLHQYGAFIFPLHVADRYSADLVRRTWTEAGEHNDPLRTLDRLLVEDGEPDLDSLFSDFVFRNATWDYEDEGLYEDVHDGYTAWYSSNRPSGRLTLPVDWQSPVHPPEGFGANYWRFIGAAAGELTLSFEGDPGTEWAVAVTTQLGEEHRVHPLDVDPEGYGELVVEVPDGITTQVVLAVAPLGDLRTTWDYRFRADLLRDLPSADSTEESPRACGCTVGGGPAWLGGLALLGLLWRRR